MLQIAYGLLNYQQFVLVDIQMTSLKKLIYT